MRYIFGSPRGICAAVAGFRSLSIMGIEGPCALSSTLSEKSLPPPPEFIEHRNKLWTKLRKEYDDFVASQPRAPIQITLPDGATVDGKAWETTPMSIAKSINKNLAEHAVIARVDGELWDLLRPFEGDATLELLNFEHKDGQYVFWHSSAHILGEALEQAFGGHLCYGPPIEEGYYYDIWLPQKDHKGIGPEEHALLDDLCRRICKENQPFERLEVTKKDLLAMFAYNQFKCRIIEEKVNTPTTTIYRCGSLIDLCRGPHVRHTGCVKAMTVTKSSSAYWEGRADAETLQRVYGISFPDPKRLKEWRHLQEEAARRDHRKLGIEQKLFFFHELSPGSCFFLPAGAHIYNTLISFIRAEYWRRGFQEVITPNIYNSALWETSGHWQHYSDNMFKIDIEKQQFGLKPMNCPGHCLMFAKEIRSHRDLPLRFADFGVLHRNEFSGALTGLTRVRRFQQDDAHIFCREDQIKEEIKSCLDFLRYVYGVFGFSFQLFLSTRPEKFMGEVELWDRAEQQLRESMEEMGLEWELNAGDGAFYGPKIDITIMDALRRRHQCATIQLDFQMPARFSLAYACEGDSSQTTNDGDAKVAHEVTLTHPEANLRRPVIIHRAILGSVERIMAILVESYGGASWFFTTYLLFSKRWCAIF
ncbi:threonyl-tRNA synthetase [Paragonimus westermani]|uniref:threonine--tRNA ligase n=1 Tax=Paragonimus westermani TaxID=34504 RepID=A0A5J4NC09_9TREM|nr:threonyl-tRNA synthetase [Paragonimus westermani]